ncbi:MAG: FxsB family radical SAM/SPASM domain protein [Micromonosporaceae bacterium]|nr:FxsB family radical SAM/SPASM domain protein [Micromonosporaceae bacterium]
MEQLHALVGVSKGGGSGHANALWPYRELNVDALFHSGWHPVAFQEFVLKIHQRCNLNCDYCYVYRMADQSWRVRPVTMSQPVWTAAAHRIAEHAQRHGLSEVQVILHGGEPLLAGIERIVNIVTGVRAAIPAGTTVNLAMQTNGVLLDQSTLRLLLEQGIHLGISLDGTQENHDLHRPHADGRGSYVEVDRAMRLLSAPEHRAAFSGILSTIDPTTDPIACYDALLAYQDRTLDPMPASDSLLSVDFLLPHANWSAPHPACVKATHPFGDWLVRLFDRWYDAPHQEIRIRFFEEIIHVVLGGSSRSENIGLAPATVAVIETDGAIEQVDALKSAYEGAAATGHSVFTDSFDEVLRHPGIVARQIGLEALSDQCRQCTLRDICGGGQYPHRYRAGSGFRNPSVYCADLARIITHIRNRVHADLRCRPAMA